MNFAGSTIDSWLSLPIDYSYECIIFSAFIALATQSDTSPTDGLCLENLHKIWEIQGNKAGTITTAHKSSEEDDSTWDSSSTRSSTYSKSTTSIIEPTGTELNPFEEAEVKKTAKLSECIAGFDEGEFAEKTRRIGNMRLIEGMHQIGDVEIMEIALAIYESIVGQNTNNTIDKSSHTK